MAGEGTLPWLPDWRDAGAYPFAELDRAGFAWEWLRRDPAYCAAALGAKQALPGRGSAAASAWGLVEFEDPQVPSPHARPLWTAEIDHSVLGVDACPEVAEPADAFSLGAFGTDATLLTTARGEHLLLSDGWRRVRLDIHTGTLCEGPVLLRYHLAGLREAQRRLVSLQRLISVVRTHRFSRRLWSSEARAMRWILALRAHDAMFAGEGQRTVARLMNERGAKEQRWRDEIPSLRLRAQRLAITATRLAGTGFAHRFLR